MKTITNIEEAKNYINHCSNTVRDELYRHLWKSYVIEDIESHMQDLDIQLTKEEIEHAAYLYTFEGKYDCNLDYWTNIENRIYEEYNNRKSQSRKEN